MEVGASLGYCLANINKYNNTSEFLADFGYIAAVNGSITYLISSIPIFGTLLLVGGMGYTTLTLYSNKTANLKSKMSKVGYMALNAGSTIGGTVTGSLIG